MDSLDNTLFDDDALGSLADMERNKSDVIKQARSSTRVVIKSKVTAQPGNSGERMKFTATGVSSDISGGGCQILFPVPLRAGDVYWLTFESTELDIDSVFARCLRCRLIREDAYEAGFKFFVPIDLCSAADHANTEALFG